MSGRALSLVVMIAAGLLTAAPSLAREPFDGAYFVRHGGAASAMFQDRSDCSHEALSLGGTASAFSDPDYGALSALSQSLDSDALHEGGLHKRLSRAVFADCMKRRGWTPLEPDKDEARLIAKASPRRPDALDAWMKAHDPPPPAPVPPPAPAAAPAAVSVPPPAPQAGSPQAAAH